MSDVNERLRTVAERVFPTGTRLLATPGEGDLVLLASWKLGTDRSRPNKRSRTVRVVISEEAMEDYGSTFEGQRECAEARFESFLRKRLATFDPSHEAPPGSEPPIEPWSIGTVELNG